MSEQVAQLVVRECKPEEFKDCDIIFSGLDSDVAGPIGKLPKPLSPLAWNHDSGIFED